MFERTGKFFKDLFGSGCLEEGSIHESWKEIENKEGHTSPSLEVQQQDERFGLNLRAYLRCFVKKDGTYYVGNHRLVENFKPIYFIYALAKNKAEGRHDNSLIDTWFQQTINGTSFYMLVVKATGERLNTMIPYTKEPATFRSFLDQLSHEFEKNMALILAEKSHE